MANNYEQDLDEILNGLELNEEDGGFKNAGRCNNKCASGIYCKNGSKESAFAGTTCEL